MNTTVWNCFWTISGRVRWGGIAHYIHSTWQHGCPITTHACALPSSSSSIRGFCFFFCSILSVSALMASNTVSATSCCQRSETTIGKFLYRSWSASVSWNESTQINRNYLLGKLKYYLNNDRTEGESEFCQPVNLGQHCFPRVDKNALSRTLRGVIFYAIIPNKVIITLKHIFKIFSPKNKITESNTSTHNDYGVQIQCHMETLDIRGWHCYETVKTITLYLDG